MLAALAACSTLVGCNSIGPSAVAQARPAYSDALAQTEAEQLLHNLVRLRYLDQPQFLQVTSVNTSYELRGSTNGLISGVFDDPLSESRGELGAGISITERPTVTYAPLQGDEFVKRLMSPIGLEGLVLLIRSGWRVEHVLVVCNQSFGGVKNAPRAAGPAHDAETDNAAFVRVAALVGAAARSDGLRLAGDRDTGYLFPVATENADCRALLEALQIPVKPEIPVVHGFARDPGTIAIETRSLLGSLFYLSLGIQLPEEHVKNGIAPMPASEEFMRVTAGFFSVHSSATRPSHAHIRTRHRGYWFYIDDRDHRSKATFSLITLLFSLQSGSRQSLQPAVTIPL